MIDLSPHWLAPESTPPGRRYWPRGASVLVTAAVPRARAGWRARAVPGRRGRGRRRARAGVWGVPTRRRPGSPGGPAPPERRCVGPPRNEDMRGRRHPAGFGAMPAETNRARGPGAAAPGRAAGTVGPPPEPLRARALRPSPRCAPPRAICPLGRRSGEGARGPRARRGGAGRGGSLPAAPRLLWRLRWPGSRRLGASAPTLRSSAETRAAPRPPRRWRGTSRLRLCCPGGARHLGGSRSSPGAELGA